MVGKRCIIKFECNYKIWKIFKRIRIQREQANSRNLRNPVDFNFTNNSSENFCNVLPKIIFRQNCYKFTRSLHLSRQIVKIQIFYEIEFIEILDFQSSIKLHSNDSWKKRKNAMVRLSFRQIPKIPSTRSESFRVTLALQRETLFHSYVYYRHSAKMLAR